MNDSSHDVTRRSFLAGAVVLPALGGLMVAQTATADAKGSKAQFKYQSTPKSGAKCSQCGFFVKGSSSTADGTCKIVDGAISPNGWCIGFAKK